MAFSEDLLNKLILALEHTKIPVGGDVAIRLQHIFNLLGITNAEELSKQKFVIGPVVARSPEEQHRFYSAFDQFVEASGVKKPEVITPVAVEVKKNVRRARWVAFVVSILVLVVYLVYSLIADSPQPESIINFKWTDSTFVENKKVVFINSSDTLHTYKFDWNFGDSTPTRTVVDKQSVEHTYHSAGEYSVSLTAHIDTITFPSVIKKIRVIKDTICNGVPFFYTMSLQSLKILFINASESNCVERYKWAFGDKTPEIYSSAISENITHEYSKAGSYTALLTAYTADTFYTYEQNVSVGDAQQAFISLLPFEPVLQYEKPPVISKPEKPIAGMIWFCILLIALPFIFAYTSYLIRKRSLTRVFKNEYQINDPPVAPYVYRLDESALSIQSERKLGELAFRLRHPEQGDAIRLDILPTISKTIRNAGFPRLIFNETKTQPSYVALVDLDSGVNQQVQLFRELLDTLEMYRVNFTVFYFRGAMETCFNEEYADGISIQKLSELYDTSRLIIYSNGTSLLNDDSVDGFVSWAPKLFNRWKNKAIITPTPRYNWDDNERRLLKLFPLYPAGLNGHLVMANSFINGRHRMFLRKKTESWLSPFPSDIEQYREYFLRDEDRKLFMWLLALSVPEKSDWNTTLLVGKVVEDQLCVPGEQLVTYKNLLLLTSVEWLQSGNLNSRHRMELYAELKKQRGAENIIQAINRELLRELEKIPVQENSSAALEKKIQMALLNYQLNDNKKNASSEHEMHYLVQTGLLSRFTKANVYNEKRGFTKFNPRKAILVASVGVLFLGLLLIPGFRNFTNAFNPAATPVADTIIDSTAAYFNNRAVEMMQKTGPGIPDSLAVLINLGKAYKLDSLNDTIRANILISRYRKGHHLYREGKFFQALETFELSPYSEYALSDGNKDDSLESLLRLRKEASDVPVYNDKLKLESLSNRALLFAKHAQGICSYYISNQIGNEVYQSIAEEIDSLLLSKSFYSIYPDKRNNLHALLAGGNILPATYKLTVIPETNQDRPLMTVTDQNQTLKKRDFNRLNVELEEGIYNISIDYPGRPNKITIHLISDSTVRIPPGDAGLSPIEYKLNVAIVNLDGKPAKVWKIELVALYDNDKTALVYDDTTSSFSRDFPANKYELRVVFPTFKQEVIELSFVLRKDTTIIIKVKEPELHKKVKIHVDDVEGKPASGIAITNIDNKIVYGKTGADGNLEFDLDSDSDKPANIHLELSIGDYKQTKVIDPPTWNNELTVNVALKDYTGYTLILFPANTQGSRSPLANAERYQQTIYDVMAAAYPNDKFVIIKDFAIANEKVLSNFKGALAAMEIELRPVVENAGNLMSFITVTSIVEPKKEPVSFQFRSRENDFKLYEQNLRKALPKPKGNNWSSLFYNKKG